MARGSTDEFIQSVMETRGLEERMRDPEVRVDGQWRIQHVAYTRRTGACERWEDR